jgi:hypothetical protein
MSGKATVKLITQQGQLLRNGDLSLSGSVMHAATWILHTCVFEGQKTGYTLAL